MMGPRAPLLLATVLLLAGCTTPVGTQDDHTETFTLSSKGTVASARSIPFDVRLKGDLAVTATSAPGPVLVVLQEAKDCGSFADQHFIPSSRYEKTDIHFTYYVPEGGDYCLSFQNRNGEPITVDVTVAFP